LLKLHQPASGMSGQACVLVALLVAQRNVVWKYARDSPYHF